MMQKVCLVLFACLFAGVASQPVQAPISQACATFCASYGASNCNSNSPWAPSASYNTTALCWLLCATWNDPSATGNSVTCRSTAFGAGGTQALCDAAAHVGTCATAQTAYCGQISYFCPNQYPPASGAEAGCAARAVSAVIPYTAPSSGNASTTSGNSLNCRMYHAAVASTYPPGDPLRIAHCSHAGPLGAQLNGQTNQNGWVALATCGDPCTNYCDSIQYACTGANAQFTDRQTCINACSSVNNTGSFGGLGGHYMAGGQFGDLFGDSFFCRHAHAQIAMNGGSLATTNCPYAGPTSATGVCQDTCASFCQQLTGACQADPSYQLWSNMGGFAANTSCLSDCTLTTTGVWGVDSTYPGSQIVSGESLNCRTYHARTAQAPGNSGTHCPHAGPLSASNVCGTMCDGFCDHAAAICTGSLAQWSSRSACMTDCNTISNNALGSLGDTSLNSFYCRWYHLNAARSASATVHCPHIVINSAACNVAPSSTGSDASTLVAPVALLSVLSLVAAIRF